MDMLSGMGGIILRASALYKQLQATTEVLETWKWPSPVQRMPIGCLGPDSQPCKHTQKEHYLAAYFGERETERNVEHAISNNEKETMNLKENGQEDMGGFGVRKVKGEM